ncbi:MAG: cobalamin-dependent protein [Deltaproteobacteria bacterium]|nr:cobalamin-dependent protein [Candidatus Zymogenaceae bacterium]
MVHSTKNNGDAVVLINPPSEVLTPETRFVRPLLNSLPQLGIASLAATLKRNGLSVSILDAQALGMSVREVVSWATAHRPRVVGLTGYTSTVDAASLIAEEIKQHNPDVATVLGGPHVTAAWERTLTRFPAIDYGFLGEGESTALELFRTLLSGKTPRSVPGAVYRDGPRIISNERPPLIDDLDALPPPAVDLFERFPSAYHPPILHSPMGTAVTLVSSRGCPYRCTFCDRGVFGERYRFHSIDYIIEQIRKFKTDYDISHIIFYDDNFTSNRAHLEELLEAIINLPFDITFNCDARVDLVDRKLLEIMKRAGAWMINYGIESGSQKLLDDLSKKVSLDRAKEAVLLTHDAQIMVKGLFMIGVPGETEQSLEETGRLLAELPFDFVNFSKYTPYPGCEDYKTIREHGEFDETWELMNAVNMVFVPNTITKEALERASSNMMAAFYKNPQRWKSYTKIIKKNPLDRIKLLKLLPGYIKYKAMRRISKGSSESPFDF